MRAIVKIQSWLKMKKQQIQFRKMIMVLKKIHLIQRMWRCYLNLKKTRDTLRSNALKLI